MRAVTNTKLSNSRIKIKPKTYEYITRKRVSFHRDSILDKSFVINAYQSETTGRYPNMLGHVYLNGNRCYVVNCFRVTGGYSSYTRFLIELDPDLMTHQIDDRTVTGTIHYDNLAGYIEEHDDRFFIYQDANIYYTADPQRVSCASMWTAADDSGHGWIYRGDINISRQIADRGEMSVKFCNYWDDDSIEVRLCDGKYYGGYNNTIHINIKDGGFNNYKLPLAPNRLSINL
jgi:hypothetical protein